MSPFPQQPEPWGDENHPDRVEWARLCRVATKLKTYGGHFDVRFLHARNDGMIAEAVADAGVVIAVLLPDKRDGGTASAVRKARLRGLPIIHVNPTARTTTLRRTGHQEAA